MIRCNTYNLSERFVYYRYTIRAYCTTIRAKQWHLIKCLATFTNSTQRETFHLFLLVMFKAGYEKNYTQNMENDKIHVHVFSAGPGGGDEGGGGREGRRPEVAFPSPEANTKITESRPRGCCSCYHRLTKTTLAIAITANVGDIAYAIVMVYNLVKSYRLQVYCVLNRR